MPPGSRDLTRSSYVVEQDPDERLGFDGQWPVGTARQQQPLYCADVSDKQQAVVDLLGMLAFGELLAFDRAAADARLAPDLSRRAVLSEMAAREIANHRRFVNRLMELGVDPEQAMAPFVEPLRAYHRTTEPGDWYEGLTKVYVGDSITDDFTAEVAALLEAPDRELICDVLHERAHSEFAVGEIRAGIAEDPKLANRLSMWARRLVGEALSQAIGVAGECPALAQLAMAAAATGASGEPSGEDADLGVLLRRLTAAHTSRMSAAGLNN